MSLSITILMSKKLSFVTCSVKKQSLFHFFRPIARWSRNFEVHGERRKREGRRRSGEYAPLWIRGSSTFTPENLAYRFNSARLPSRSCKQSSLLTPCSYKDFFISFVKFFLYSIVVSIYIYFCSSWLENKSFSQRRTRRTLYILYKTAKYATRDSPRLRETNYPANGA